jgi:nitrous oxide reductase accessory protein NosL
MMLLLAGAAAFAKDDVDRHRECNHCGMDRKAYGYSRMLVRYEDGTETGVCSLRCVVVETSGNPGKKVKELLAADRDSRKLINAETAIWVMGGKKPGVMTNRPKWAFASRGAAGAFVKSYGGKIVSWEQALAAARDDAANEHLPCCPVRN